MQFQVGDVVQILTGGVAWENLARVHKVKKGRYQLTYLKSGQPGVHLWSAGDLRLVDPACVPYLLLGQD